MILWYTCFGILHELAHLATYAALTDTISIPSRNTTIQMLLRSIFGRYSVFPLDESANGNMFWVRHAGWFFSLAFAVVLHYLFIGKNKRVNTHERLVLDL